MILVIGGYGQGKGSFAKNKFHMEDMDFTDGEDCDLQEILERKGIRRLHLLIRRMMEEQRDPYAYFMENRKLLKDKIILTDEIGLGIVPMEKENRFGVR